MDENNNNSENDQRNVENEQSNTDINNFSMDNSGNIRTGRSGTAAIGTSSRTYIVLGWISAALTAFISPYFAIAGIVFGVLANRNVRGSGNIIIITNVVLAAINLLLGLMFGLFLLTAMRRMMLGY